MNYSKESTAALIQYMKVAAQSFQFGQELRSNFEKIDREYSRRGNLGGKQQRAKNANDAGNKGEIQDPTVPVLYPQTEAAHTYLSGVFLSGYPIFPTVTSPENAEAGNMMDAYNSENARKAGWVRHLSMAMRDGLKYNIMAVEVCWERKTTFSLQKQADSRLIPKPVIWQGNYINHLDLYNCFFDTRVTPAEVHLHGEFAGYHKIMSRVRLKQFMQDLPEEYRMNGKEAFEASVGESQYYVPNITEKLKHDPRRVEFDWIRWALGDSGGSSNSQRIAYKNVYEITILYARIVPEDFKLQVPARSTPQIWKLIFVNQQILIYAERLTNAHNYLPIIFGSPTEDGLAYQTLSYAENLLEVQDISTALYGARIAAARRSVSDRGIYDPRMINPADINSSNPSAKIPVRPGSYLDDIRKAYFPIPFDDSASGSLIRDTLQVVDFGRSISGINRGQEGQFTKGNRTLEEFDRIMQNSDARLQVMAIFLEDQFFTPIKEIIKYNVLQYAQPGDVYYPKSGTSVTVDPSAMQDAALDFKISDGLLPASKIADSDFLTSFMQLLMASPVLQQKFDIVKLVSYIASLRNVPNLEAFAAMPPQGVGMPQQGQPTAGQQPGNVLPQQQLQQQLPTAGVT